MNANWAKLPEGMAFGYTHGIVVDSNNHVYVFHTGSPSVVVFDAQGNYLRAFGEEFAGGAHGFYLHQEAEGEFLYATDIERAITVKMTLGGEIVLRLPAPDRPDLYDETHKFIPTDVAVGPTGDIYVADGYGQSWIHQHDRNGRYIRSWGGAGSEPGQLNCPHGISIDTRRADPEIYVADRANHRIQVFTLEGQHKRFVTEHMIMPCNFYFHKNDMYFPDLISRITLFDQSDHLITHLGEDKQASKQEGWPNLPKSYYQPDKFSSPHALCVDSDDNLYVVEWISDGRVSKLTRV